MVPEPIPIDVRVIAATNRDLDQAIEEGSFRQDLYYRLSVFSIQLPPLRDRAEDIPLLVEYLTQRYAARAGKRVSGVSRRTVELLTAYHLPGNIRELQNVIQPRVEAARAISETRRSGFPGRRVAYARVQAVERQSPEATTARTPSPIPARALSTAEVVRGPLSAVAIGVHLELLGLLLGTLRERRVLVRPR